MQSELEALPTADLAELATAALAELARRAGGDAAAPKQLDLLPELGPIDPTTVDLDERLPDGSRRWLAPKEAAVIVRTDPGTVVRKIKAGGSGVRIGGRYYLDAINLRGRR
ncbi:hypothetical protein PYH37_002825 [Sinorhizobium numidicum]|uniref:Helix-turn-helix domain-containing protein n=1 Tax=Sinorhizobium numidicum TaxID=680248 RepID=A0ABY8D506_9HYPH|nr:hypothetical protein [Sinorhizobium numidicum]WEX77981.1 hypothetical protein PYH37_002825 [Sinorhizobium numidicum]WEX84640.1 hypothetical protein PYH38_003538 [Sinorhizobium numidicum]